VLDGEKREGSIAAVSDFRPKQSKLLDNFHDNTDSIIAAQLIIDEPKERIKQCQTGNGIYIRTLITA
jgi:hypothetical protein